MNTVADWAGELPNGWAGGQAVTKWWRGEYVHLYRLKKPCAQCQAEMQLDVTRAALEGKAKNAGLHLKRCAKCRAASKALGTSSRPKVAGQEPFQAADVSELERLRTAVATMTEELDGLYSQNRTLRDRLAKYELEPALTKMDEDRRQPRPGKMPWEQ